MKTSFSGLPKSLILLMIGVCFLSVKDSGMNKPVIRKDQANWAENKLKTLSLEQKIAQFFMVAVYSSDAEKELAETERLVKDLKIGGLIFFQGDRKDLKSAVSRFQSVAEVPLLIGMDAEWGVQMRLFGEERFPYAYTLGAADDLELSSQIGEAMAQECRDLGIHMNFSPVADVNIEPDNPVIGFRSFGENPKKVGDHVRAFVNAFETNGVLASVKHFPGHGDTKVDSHHGLPTVDASMKELSAIHLEPFREGIRANTSSIMVGHLNVPALDNSGTPTSLSKKSIDFLKNDLGFKGLVISDALNMKAVSDRYGKTEVVVKAFEAGCDILLFPESVGEAINAIKKKVDSGSISLAEINERCLKILKAKHKVIFDNEDTYVRYSPSERKQLCTEVYEKAVTLVKNEEKSLPIDRLDKKILRVSIGMHTFHLRKGIDRFASVDHAHYFSVADLKKELNAHVKKYDRIVFAAHSNTVRAKNDYGFKGTIDSLNRFLPELGNFDLILFGNPMALKKKDLSKFNSVVIAYENYYLAQDAVSQLIFGAIPAIGKLPIHVPGTFERAHGIQLPWGGRLKFSSPEELGIDTVKLLEADKIVENAIKKGAFPGCQVVAAVDGKIFFRRNYGTIASDDTKKVQDNTMYDIASVSKIAGSTVGLIHMVGAGKVDLDQDLQFYLKDLTGNKYGTIRIREMMAHQAGLPAWIPFFKRTLTNGQLNSSLYSETKKGTHTLHVAKDLWLKESYVDSIYDQITSAPLGPKKYLYSDLGYYFMKKILEGRSGKSLDDFLYEELYNPMGLRSMKFEPYKVFPLSMIAPTENDKVFRKQLIHGFVHDPGAAMLGGVGGHAGLFSNATDLASLMQMLLNKGKYGGVQYLKSEVIEEFTKAQFKGNRRGIGFDRPVEGGGGTCHELASSSSFGHSGFTGTLAWADPETGINFVFLSNRVNPDAENWKIRDMNVRTEVQRVIYEAVKTRRK
ncbi:MAG: glycosyl hydrolase [Bacteroidetes bacterium]|nr:MAG: glycosyl hydrolase [Bacteroidota bacterium]